MLGRTNPKGVFSLGDRKTWKQGPGLQPTLLPDPPGGHVKGGSVTLLPAQLGGVFDTSVLFLGFSCRPWAGDKHWAHMATALGNSGESRGQAVLAGGNSPDENFQTVCRVTTDWTASFTRVLIPHLPLWTPGAHPLQGTHR